MENVLGKMIFKKFVKIIILDNIVNPVSNYLNNYIQSFTDSVKTKNNIIYILKPVNL